MESYNCDLLKKYLNYPILTKQELDKKNTKNLLRLFNLLRKFTIYGGYCPCCSVPNHENNPQEFVGIPFEEISKEMNKYKKYIRTILSTREHLDKKPKRVR